MNIISYLNTNEGLDVDDAHQHAKGATTEGATLVWLDGGVYDTECEMLDVHKDDRLEHDGDISVVYMADEKPSQKQIARALIEFVGTE